ncbi:MAG: hypothetical protein NTZ33_15405 [Bacteroidetes bacterium]|nr:hypothetical protein [Bacteroidota bacterium]
MTGYYISNFYTGECRFGFNGQEKDQEIYNNQSTTTALFWEYDARIGRRWNRDPKSDASISNYASFANNPIWFCDPFGDTMRIAGVSTWDNNLSKNGEFFKDRMGKLFNDKVDVEYSTSNDMGDYSMTFKVKEGAVLNEQEQAKFDYINKINSDKEDFKVCLFGNDEGGYAQIPSKPGSFFTNNLKVDNGRETFNVAFNIDYLVKVDKNASENATMTSKDLILLGITENNYNTYNKISNTKIKSFYQGKNTNFLGQKYNLFGFNIYKCKAVFETVKSKTIKWIIHIPEQGAYDPKKIDIYTK